MARDTAVAKDGQGNFGKVVSIFEDTVVSSSLGEDQAGGWDSGKR